MWDSRLKEGKVDTNKVVLLWRTPPYADYHWIAQGNLDQRFGTGFTSKLQQSLLNLSPSQPRLPGQTAGSHKTSPHLQIIWGVEEA